MAEKFIPYDPADSLETEEAVAVFMSDAFETNDPAYIAQAFGVAARSKGMTQVAKKTGISREQLYRSFSSKGNPTLRSTLKVMGALGIKMAAKTAVDA